VGVFIPEDVVMTSDEVEACVGAGDDVNVKAVVGVVVSVVVGALEAVVTGSLDGVAMTVVGSDVAGVLGGGSFEDDKGITEGGNRNRT